MTTTKKTKAANPKQEEFARLYAMRAHLNTTIADIAERLEVSEKTCYNWLNLESVKQLIDGILEQMKSQFLETLVSYLKEEALRGNRWAIDANLKWSQAYPALYNIKLSGDKSEESDEEIMAEIERLEAEIKAIRCFYVYEISETSDIPPVIRSMIHSLQHERERLQLLSYDPANSEALQAAAELTKELHEALMPTISSYPAIKAVPVSDGAHLKAAAEIEEE